MNKPTTRESTFFWRRRQMRERILERVGGVGSETGQRLLDKWWREDSGNMNGRNKPANIDEAVYA